MRNKNFIRLAVIGTIFSLGGVFVVPQFKNNDAQASEPTKLVAFEKQGSHLGKTINSVRGSKTVKVTLDKAQKEAQKKTQAKKETNKETKTSQIATSKEETKETKVESTTTSTQSVEVTSTVTNTSNTNQAPATQPQSAPVQQSAPAQAAPAPQPQSAPAQVAPAPQVDTSGFNFNGHHYPIAWFSGSGYVPADGNIYRWSELPNHYLIERAGMAGGTIRELGVGSKVTIDGQTYTVFKVLSGVANDENAFNLLTSQGAAVTFQSCDATYGANGLANLTI